MLTGFILVCAAGSNGTRPALPRTDFDGVQHILIVLRGMPQPGMTKPTQRSRQAQILDDLDTLDRFGTCELRLALKLFVREVKGDHMELSKVLVMNRFIFNLPARTPRKFGWFHSWWIMSTDPRSYIAPLSISRNGEIVYDRKGEFLAYSGPPYTPLEEFDYYHRAYGRRKTNRRK